MKYLAFLITILTVNNTYATQNPSCELEEFFRQTEVYKSAVLDNEAKKLEMERESLSLLPNISANVGQQSTNNSSFKGIHESSVSLGLSQSVYSGGRYNKFKNKILNDIEYNELMINDKRNRYLIDLYRSIIDYNYKYDLYKLYSSQLDKQKEQLEVSKAKLISGDIAEIEHDIINLRKEEIQKDVDAIRNEVRQSELDIKTQFNIPEESVKKITSKHILSCKVEGSGLILDKGKIILKQSENSNYELRMASMQPSVSLSLNMRPPSSGTLNSITTKKTDFSASVNVTFPLSSFFSVNNIKNDYAISIRRINNSYDEKLKLYIREKERINSKINDLKKNIALTQKKIELKGKEVDYVQSRLREKKDTIMSYYRQLDEFENEQIKLKQNLREYEYYKTYINILD